MSMVWVGACAGLPQRGLLATGYPDPSARKFWKSSFLRPHEQLRPTRFPTLPSESYKGVRHEIFQLFRQKASRPSVSEVC